MWFGCIAKVDLVQLIPRVKQIYLLALNNSRFPAHAECTAVKFNGERSRVECTLSAGRPVPNATRKERAELSLHSASFLNWLIILVLIPSLLGGSRLMGRKSQVFPQKRDMESRDTYCLSVPSFVPFKACSPFSFPSFLSPHFSFLILFNSYNKYLLSIHFGQVLL